MRIALIISSNGWGGAEEFVYQLARAYMKNGHDVIVIGNSEVIPYYKDLNLNEKLIDIGNLFESQRFRRFPFVRAFFRHFYAARAAKKLVTELDRINPEVVHFNQPSVLLLWLYTLLNDIKKRFSTVYTAHGLDFEMNVFLNTLLPSALVKRLIEAFNIVVTPSKFMMKELKRIGISGNIKRIPNGIEYNERDYMCISNSHGFNFSILFPGGAKPLKGGINVLKSIYYLKKLEKIKNITLLVTGYVPRDHEYFKMIEQYKIENNVNIVGFLPHEAHNKLIAASDILVMPSKKEAFGIVFLEAMALGKPIIATNRDGIPEVVENHHNGYLCDGSPEEIARLIKFLYEAPKIRRKISHINRERAKRFDWRIIADRYISSVYKNPKSDALTLA